MSTVSPAELWKAWKLDNMPVETAMGQVLQNLVKQQTAIETLTQALSNQRADMDRLIAHTRLPPGMKGKPRPSKPDETPDPGQSG
jgi:hypothetical protein